MPHRDSILQPLDGITMEDDLGIVYLVENAQQFWSELEDILTFSKDVIPTLEQLDLTLRRCTSLCASYHELYLQSPLQLEHACGMLLDSELFAFHSERMCEILVGDAQSNTNPHTQLICYNILLLYGRRRTDFFRSSKRWAPLVPLLMDHVLVDVEVDVEDTYFGVVSASFGSTSSSGYGHDRNGSFGGEGGSGSVPVPIEAMLRSLGVKVLYEMCRVQKLTLQQLKVFDDPFIDYLFDLVEQTRHLQDETFNYSVIKLIVALNEQFMVAAISPNDDLSHPHTNGHGHEHGNGSDSKNRVLRILMRRLDSSKTFGENMIFMLNRAQRTPEDQCMQLLVLKLLYLLFTTKGTEEYFYTNDLCVLVDVFLRELVDLDEDSESLRHTYLRVLHPLLTKTQLRSLPYKRPQILYALESLIDSRNSSILVKDINPTTKRLVERCLGGEWCVGLRKVKEQGKVKDLGMEREREENLSDRDGIGSSQLHLGVPGTTGTGRSLKTSRSMEFSASRTHAHRRPPSPPCSTSSSPAPGHIPGHSGSKPKPKAPKSVATSTSMLAGFPPTPAPAPAPQISPTSPTPNLRQHLVQSPERRGSDASYTGVAVASTLSATASSPLASGFSNLTLSRPSSGSTPTRSDIRIQTPRKQGSVGSVTSVSSVHVDGVYGSRPGGFRVPSGTGTLGGTLDSTLIIPSSHTHGSPQLSPTAMSASSYAASVQSTHSHSSATSATSADSGTDRQEKEKPKQRRSAPAPPVQKHRRKPPAVPVRTGVSGSTTRGGTGASGHTGGSGVVFTSIKSSATSTSTGMGRG